MKNAGHARNWVVAGGTIRKNRLVRSGGAGSSLVAAIAPS
jgi:hypothetical protein